MSRYSNSYPEEAAMNEAVTVSGRSGLKYNDVEPMQARRSLGIELVHHVDLSQQLHEQIGGLFEALAPMLAPGQAEACADGRMIEGAPHSEMVDRADAHSRSLQEAIERLQVLRSRIEL